MNLNTISLPWYARPKNWLKFPPGKKKHKLNLQRTTFVKENIENLLEYS